MMTTLTSRFFFTDVANLSTQLSIIPSTLGETRLCVRSVWAQLPSSGPDVSYVNEPVSACLLHFSMCDASERVALSSVKCCVLYAEVQGSGV